MAAPTPIHRDPEEDGEDYGCFTDEANAAVASLVENTIEAIQDGTLETQDDIIDYVGETLGQIGEGSTDTVVKENVAQALAEAIAEAKIPFDGMAIYGW